MPLLNGGLAKKKLGNFTLELMVCCGTPVRYLPNSQDWWGNSGLGQGRRGLCRWSGLSFPTPVCTSRHKSVSIQAMLPFWCQLKAAR